MRSTDNSMLQNRRRQFERFDSSLFIEFKPLKGVASYFLGMTNNISCEGLNLTFQNVNLDAGERLQLKLRQPQTNTIVSFLGDVIWQKKTGTKYSAGVRFCDAKKKNKKILLKVLSDCCNISVKSLSDSSHIKKSLNNPIHEQFPPASDINAAHKLHSRIIIKQRSKLSWLHKTTFIFAITSAVFFLPAIIETFENASSKSMSELMRSTAIDNSTLLEVVEENIPSVIKENEHEITLPEIKRALMAENNFYIQIASLKDPDIAHRMLSELKPTYPSAYLFVENNFHEVRIPDIKTSEQGYALLNEIELTFDIKAILVKRFN